MYVCMYVVLTQQFKLLIAVSENETFITDMWCTLCFCKTQFTKRRLQHKNTLTQKVQSSGRHRCHQVLCQRWEGSSRSFPPLGHILADVNKATPHKGQSQSLKAKARP